MLKIDKCQILYFLILTHIHYVKTISAIKITSHFYSRRFKY